MRLFLSGLVFLIGMLLSSPFVMAVEEAPLKNAGFVPANIWYSKDPFWGGEKIRIYTIIFNGSLYDLTGVVEFYDNQVLIGSTDFSLAGSGRVRDVWVDWVPKEGKHAVTTRIIKTKISGRDGKKRDVVLENAVGGVDTRTIDLDTDLDGVGNQEDEDDDNDGVLDGQEVRYGLDPLKKDTNGDGVVDSKELESLLVKTGMFKDGIASTTKIVGDAGRLVERAKDAIPDPVKDFIASTVGIGEPFRREQQERLGRAKDEKFQDIETIEARNQKGEEASKAQGKVYIPEDVAEKPVAYAMFGLYALAESFFKVKVVFYGFVLYAVYRLLRFLVGKMRSRFSRS